MSRRGRGRRPDARLNQPPPAGYGWRARGGGGRGGGRRPDARLYQQPPAGYGWRARGGGGEGGGPSSYSARPLPTAPPPAASPAAAPVSSSLPPSSSAAGRRPDAPLYRPPPAGYGWRARGGGGRRGGRRPDARLYQQPPAGYGCRARGGGGEGGGPSSYSARPLPTPPPPAASPAAAPVSSSPPSSSEKPSFQPPELDCMHRPGYGAIGKEISVRVNHVLVRVKRWDLHHYNVSITPKVSSKTVSGDIIEQLVAQRLDMPNLVYDGRENVYTAGPLPFESGKFVVTLDNDDCVSSSSSGATGTRNSLFNVAIKFASKLDPYDVDCPQETIRALSVVLRDAPSKIYTVVGRSFLSREFGEPGELGSGIEYWKGYHHRLHPTQMGLSLNIDVSACPVYEPILVTDFVRKHCNIEFSSPLSPEDRLKIEEALIGIKVDFNTGAMFSRRYKVTGVTAQPTTLLMFTLKGEKTQISVADHYRQKYGTGVDKLPALQAGSVTEPTYLPVERCTIAPGQRYYQRLNVRQVSNFLKATCQGPQERERGIEDMVRHNNLICEPIANLKFGIQVKGNLEFVKARVLPSPRVLHKNGGSEMPRMGQWNMPDDGMYTGGQVEFWTCVNFSKLVDGDFPSVFCNRLVNTCCSRGMFFRPDPLIPIQSAQGQEVEMALRNIHKKCVEKLEIEMPGKQLQLLIIILPDDKESYRKIKRVCETELGIISQCCRHTQASKYQYFESLSLKINVKVGGCNSMLNDAINPLGIDLPTIIFGADVSHPVSKADRFPSIAAVVASMDWPGVTKYRGIFSAQGPRVEIIQDLYKESQLPEGGDRGMILDQLWAFRKSTGLKPKRIIFYRDGVSESEFSQVLLEEMVAIRKACSKFEDGYAPPITFVVVVKRHHTRLFPTGYHRNRRGGNILPGTVVDTQICHPTRFDFYLNSHAGFQGTSRPIHYHVLYDENNFSADSLQTLTNNLCYTYARCTHSVSMVAPAYYAHLLAARARCYMEDEATEGRVECRPLLQTKDNVKDVMFYC